MSLGRGAIRDLLERYGIEPSRALGQNFLADPNTVDRVVRLAGIRPGDQVIEVGPGLGSLTVGLAGAGARVVAIELDRHVLPALRDVVETSGVRSSVDIVNADANHLDWREFFRGRPAGPWKLVANLPYNVATSVVLDVLDHAPEVVEILVMVQREVAERLAASPGGAEYGIPSVKVAYWGSGEVVGRVPAAVFHPPPRVESALVRIVRAPAPATDADPALLFQLVRTAFGQRRKMLRRSLHDLVSPEAFADAGIEPTARPQELDVQRWGRLARAVDTRT